MIRSVRSSHQIALSHKPREVIYQYPLPITFTIMGVIEECQNFREPKDNTKDGRAEPWRENWPPRKEDILHAEKVSEDQGMNRKEKLVLSTHGGGVGKNATQLYLFGDEREFYGKESGK